MLRARRRRVLVPVVLGLLLAGCSGKSRKAAEEEVHLANLAKLYGQYLAKNKGQSPPDAAALKKFVKTLDKERLEALGVDPSNLDSLFISPRDKQEYVVRKKPPQKGVPDPMAPPTVVLYEQTGDGGR